MDCTQVIETEELDDSLPYKYKVKVAELKVNGECYPIYSGGNRIGRDPEFCSVVVNHMTLSKEHAVIEVDHRFSHLIYDLGSKNKTKLGKMTMKPHVRYQLSDKSEIYFGDLLAEYLVLPEEEEGRPYGVIQESDDEVIPDTPMQIRTKDSSSSREDSPTIFEMETECQMGYDEPCVKIVSENCEADTNFGESRLPEDRNKETLRSNVLSGTSEEKVGGEIRELSTTPELVLHENDTTLLENDAMQRDEAPRGHNGGVTESVVMREGSVTPENIVSCHNATGEAPQDAVLRVDCVTPEQVTSHETVVGDAARDGAVRDGSVTPENISNEIVTVDVPQKTVEQDGSAAPENTAADGDESVDVPQETVVRDGSVTPEDVTLHENATGDVPQNTVTRNGSATPENVASHEEAVGDCTEEGNTRTRSVTPKSIASYEDLAAESPQNAVTRDASATPENNAAQEDGDTAGNNPQECIARAGSVTPETLTSHEAEAGDVLEETIGDERSETVGEENVTSSEAVVDDIPEVDVDNDAIPEDVITCEDTAGDVPQETVARDRSATPENITSPKNITDDIPQNARDGSATPENVAFHGGAVGGVENGHENNPKDVCSASTGKQDENLEVSSKENKYASKIEEVTEDQDRDEEYFDLEIDEDETSEQVESNDSGDDKVAEKLPDNAEERDNGEDEKLESTPEDLDEDIFNAPTQVIVPATKTTSETSVPQNDKSRDDRTVGEAQESSKETCNLDSETNGNYSASGSVINNLPSSSVIKKSVTVEEKPDDIQHVQVSDDKDSTEEVEDSAAVDSETNSQDIYNAPTQVIKVENNDDEIFKVPMAVKRKMQVKEAVPPCDEREVKDTPEAESSDSGVSEGSESIYEAQTQVYDVDNTYGKDAEKTADMSEETEDTVGLDENKGADGKADSVDPDAETDDDSIYSAATQIIQRKDPDESEEVTLDDTDALDESVVTTSAEETNGKESEAGEENGETERDSPINDRDDSLYDAATQLIPQEKKEVVSDKVAQAVENESEQNGEVLEKSDEKDDQQAADTSVEILDDDDDDSFFVAPTQVRVEKSVNVGPPVKNEIERNDEVSRKSDMKGNQEAIDSSVEILDDEDEDGDVVDDDDDSFFIAATQDIRVEKNDVSSKVSLSAEEERGVEKDIDENRKRAETPDLEVKGNVETASIHDLETQLFEQASKDSAPVKPVIRKSVTFVDISDDEDKDSEELALETHPEESPQTNGETDCSGEPAQIIVSRNDEVTICDEEKEADVSKYPENAASLEQNVIKQSDVSDSDKLDEATEERVSPTSKALDDTDDSIHTVATQMFPAPDNIGESEEVEKNDLPKESRVLESARQADNEASPTQGGADDDVTQDFDLSPEFGNDSFFEAPTQMYPSNTKEDEMEGSRNDDKVARSSLSRSSSYSSIHDAPTQLMDELEASHNQKQEQEKAGEAEKSSEAGPSVSAEEAKDDEKKTAVQQAPRNRNAGRTSRSYRDDVILILPSTPELRRAARQLYGGSDSDESQSVDGASPILQRRTRKCVAVRKRLTDSLGMGKPTFASTPADGNGATASSSNANAQKQPPTRTGAKKQLKLTSKRREPKGEVTSAAPEERNADKAKKITDFWKPGSSSGHSSANEEEKGEEKREEKTSTEAESGRPSRQRKLTWKARENSQELLFRASPQRKDSPKGSPGPSRQSKDQTPAGAADTEDKSRKGRSKGTDTKGDRGSSSESKSERSEDEGQKIKESDVPRSPSKNRRTLVMSSPAGDKEEKMNLQTERAKRSLRLKASEEVGTSVSKSAETGLKAVSGDVLDGVGKSTESLRSKNKPKRIAPSSDQEEKVDSRKSSRTRPSRTTSTSSDSNPEPRAMPRSEKRKREAGVTSPSKRLRETRLPSSSSEQAEEKSKGVNKTGTSKETARSRRKQNVDTSDSGSKKETGPENRENENVDKRMRGLPRSSPDSSKAEKELEKAPSTPVSSDNERKSLTTPESDLEVTMRAGKRGRPRKSTPVSGGASSSDKDEEEKYAKLQEKSSMERTPSRTSKQVENTSVKGGKGGRPKRSSEASSVTSSSDIEPKTDKRALREQRERDASSTQTDSSSNVAVQGRGRPMRSVPLSRALSSRVESKSALTGKRTQDAELCDTPKKQRKMAVSASKDEIVDTNKRGRSNRSAAARKTVTSSDSESQQTESLKRLKRHPESDISETPKKQRRTNIPSAPVVQDENIDSSTRGRRKRGTLESSPVLAKKESKSRRGETTLEKAKEVTPVASRPRRPRNTSSQPEAVGQAETKDLEKSRSHKRNAKVPAGEKTPSIPGSPAVGSSRRRKKPLLQPSSTESDGQSTQSEGTPKRSSRLTLKTTHHIMFTGVSSSGAEENAIKKLGGKIVQEPEECTVLITDKIRRTLKFLCIMGQGKPIVSLDWIKKSQKSGQFLDPWNFIVKDKEMEKKYNFQLQKSLKEASSKKLLDGYSVFATPSVKPPPSDMKGIVENSGGQFLVKPPPAGKWLPKSFVISCAEDKKACAKLKKCSAPIVSAEVVLTGILQQKLNVEEYVLKL